MGKTDIAPVGIRGEVVIPEDVIEQSDIEAPGKIEFVTTTDGILLKEPSAEISDCQSFADTSEGEGQSDGGTDVYDEMDEEARKQAALDRAIKDAGLGDASEDQIQAQDRDGVESDVGSEHEDTETGADESDAVFPAFKEDDDDANAAEALGFVATEYNSDVDPDQESESNP
jgi:bifunctional DNA-binding transcriptional regulator/antitoxin component of YhaV-PrlF toxin-antitoxin module